MNENNIPNASRRNMLRAGAAMAIAGVVAQSTIAQAQQKMAKNMVMYQESPGANGQKCRLCAAFQPPSGCSMVAGTINPEGWCGAFMPKST